MLRVSLAILATSVLLAAACGGQDSAVAILPQAPASIAQLIGPWQPQPFVLDPALRSRVEQTCRRDMERGPNSVAALVDVRGGGVAVVRMIGADAGACEALEITAAGQINGAGGGWRADGVEQLAPIGATELANAQVGSVGGGSLKVQGWSVIGRAGPDIASVEVEPVGVPPILATLENGWFAGWWPANVPPDRRGDPAFAPDVVVRGYDAAGALLTEIRP
jgi:hypothetical protein